MLAPTFFSILFAAMLTNAFRDFDQGVFIQFQSDGKLFNLKQLQAKTEVMKAFLWEFLFTDNCALATHSHENIQYIMDHFSTACRHFGLAISLSKTEAMY